jgi:two-component system, LytTR family, response regulator
MIHTVIIDDEIRAIRGLEIMLTKFIQGVKIVATTTDAKKGVEIINDYRPDLVFLDINMPGLNGFELLEQLEFRNFNLVFSTAHQEHALKALKLDAVDYLLKPVGLDELKTTVEKVIKRAEEKKILPDLFTLLKATFERRNLRVPLVTKGNISYVEPDQVLYIEASSHHTTVVMADGSTEKVNYGLKDYEALLCKPNSQFMRIHLSYIVNTNHITRYLKEDGGYIVVNGVKTIPVSKNKKHDLFRILNLIDGEHMVVTRH